MKKLVVLVGSLMLTALPVMVMAAEQREQATVVAMPKAEKPKGKRGRKSAGYWERATGKMGEIFGKKDGKKKCAGKRKPLSKENKSHYRALGCEKKYVCPPKTGACSMLGANCEPARKKNKVEGATKAKHRRNVAKKEHRSNTPSALHHKAKKHAKVRDAASVNHKTPYNVEKRKAKKPSALHHKVKKDATPGKKKPKKHPRRAGRKQKPVAPITSREIAANMANEALHTDS